jgi:hypothetical protein
MNFILTVMCIIALGNTRSIIFYKNKIINPYRHFSTINKYFKNYINIKNMTEIDIYNIVNLFMY